MSEPAHPSHKHHPKVETAPMHDPTDAWHDHTSDERPQVEHGEIRNPAMVMGVGVGLFLAVVVSVVVVDNFYKWYVSQALAAASVASAPNSPAIEARALKTDTLKLQTSPDPSWIVLPPVDDKSKPTAVARIPLKAAAEKVASEYAARMGGKVSAAEPATQNPAQAAK